MERTSTVLAAFEAGKLPSTQQTNNFIDWLAHVGLTQLEPTAHTALSAQGRVLADDVRGVLDAYKQLGKNKNSDNILQEALWHLTSGDLTTTDDAAAVKDQALADITAIRSALRTLVSTLWASASAEGSSLLQDLFSVIRLALADAAGAVQGQAGAAKEHLMNIEEGVQRGERDTLGRNKQRLEDEKDTKVAWQHGMDTVRDAGTSKIGVGQETSAKLEENAEKATTRLQDAFYKLADRAQSDPEYRKSLDTVCGVLQDRINRMVDSAADPNTTLATFVADPTPEQHVPKALELIRTLVERFSGTQLTPLFHKLRTCSSSIAKDAELKTWFDEFFALLRKNFTDVDYARSEESALKRKDLRMRWGAMLEKDQTWREAVEAVKTEFAKVEGGLKSDADLNRLKAEHAKLGEDIERGLVEAGQEAKTGMQAAVEQATWFWQDLFKVYVPRIMSKMGDVPIPRTEFKDAEIEFVLENLDISSLNILPSHVYIRNITDVDIQTSAKPEVGSKTALGALTHIKIQALQLALKDVSFWYKDKNASVGPSEFTGLLGLQLPEKGIDVELKLRLIPQDQKGAQSREEKKHFHVIEVARVSISDEVGFEVRDSNHAVLVTLFRPLVLSRLREALAKTLSEQLRAVVDYADGIAFDVSRRREVFADTGLGAGASLAAAVWSEIGKLEREQRAGPVDMDWKATGTGVIVEQRVRVGADAQGEGGEVRKSAFAMGAEPQILAGEKRGPLGTGSEPIGQKLARVGEDVLGMPVDKAAQRAGGAVQDMDVDVGKMKGAAEDTVKGVMREGKRQVAGFRRSVERKREAEAKQEGWKSTAFDF